MNKFHEHKIRTQQVPRTRINQQAMSSMKKVSFGGGKIHVQISQSEKSTCNKFHE